MVRKRFEVLAFIPARGGSKSIPRKNIRLLAGYPLVAYSIAAALEAHRVTRVIVSTDDREIADIAHQYGAEVPFMRPRELAQDDTPDLPVFQHALRWLKENDKYHPEMIVHLRPTSPLRRIQQIDRGVQLLYSHPEADSVRSVAPPLQNPYKMWRIGRDGWMHPLLKTNIPEPYNMPRQRLPSAYWQTGYVDVTRWQTVMEMSSMTGKRILPLLLESSDWTDIDSEISIELAEFLIRSGRVKPLVPKPLYHRD